MKKIGFIGVGVMGKSMVLNLIKAGYEVSIYTRTKSKVEDVILQGAIWADSIKNCVHDQDVIMSMVGYPKDVEEIYFGDNGILKNARKGTIVIDFTTSSPELAKKIYTEAQSLELSSLDAPVSGGDIGAANGTLSIMAGGDEMAYTKVLPILEVLGKTIHYVGEAGYGQHTKMANQIALAGAIAGVCEAIHYTTKVGLDPKIMLDCICSGAAGSWQMTNNGPAMLTGHFDPGFYIKHYVKDLLIASKETENYQMDLGVMEEVLRMYQQLEKEGKGDLGTQALIQYYTK